MKKQYSLLKNSLMLMMTALIESNENQAQFEMIGKPHSRFGHNISPELYDLWLNCLIDTAHEFGQQFDSSIELTWQKTLQHGIDKMKIMY